MGAGAAGTDGFTAPPAACVGTIYCKHSNTNCDIRGPGISCPISRKPVSMRQLHPTLCSTYVTEPESTEAVAPKSCGLVFWGPGPSRGLLRQTLQVPAKCGALTTEHKQGVKLDLCKTYSLAHNLPLKEIHKQLKLRRPAFFSLLLKFLVLQRTTDGPLNMSKVFCHTTAMISVTCDHGRG